MLEVLCSYTFLTVLAVDLLATSGDITMTWTSPIIPKLQSNDSSINPFGGEVINDDHISWISSLINIGAMIGPFPFSFLADTVGRKWTLLSIAVPHIISYLLLAFGPNIYWYYFARVLGGLAVGGGYALLPMYIAEVAEDSNRGMLSVTLNIFFTLGNLIPYVIGPYLAVEWFNIILACVPTLFFVLFLILAPESPYFLMSKNRMDEAELSLKRLRGPREKGAMQEELEHIKSALEHGNEDGNATLLDLFRTRSYLKALLISLVLIMAQQLSGINAVLFYTEEIFAAAGIEGLSPEMSSIIAGLVLFSTSFVTPFFADRLGRKLLLLVSCIGMALAHIAIGAFFYLKDFTATPTEPISWLPIVSMVVYITSFNFGLGPIPWTISSELFPSSVKSTAASLTAATCWTTSFLVTKFFNDMTQPTALDKAGTFWFYSGCCLLTFCFTYFVVFETKGKSFEEIQRILEGRDEDPK